MPQSGGLAMAVALVIALRFREPAHAAPIGGATLAHHLRLFRQAMGQRVLVLEQHYIAGGCTHEFTEKGFTFDSGVHCRWRRWEG